MESNACIKREDVNGEAFVLSIEIRAETQKELRTIWERIFCQEAPSEHFAIGNNVFPRFPVTVQSGMYRSLRSCKSCVFATRSSEREPCAACIEGEEPGTLWKPSAGIDVREEAINYE